MDFSTYFRLALTPGNALLPGATVTWLSLHLGWAIVLGAVTLQLASRLPTRGRWTLAGLVLLWTLLPGAASPAFWLGLAFQSPSLMSVVFCIVWLLPPPGRVPGVAALSATADSGSQKVLFLLGVVLGWVLLLDALAWFPVSIYAWGFGSAAVALALLAAALLWLLSGSRATVSLLAVLALFVLTRAPSGNLWDALLDPLLWLALQIGWLFNLVRRHSMARRSSPATRA
jgi:hypothetical protein